MYVSLRGKETTGKITLRWILEVKWGGVDWIGLAQDMDK
jgi:hypothetical protein